VSTGGAIYLSVSTPRLGSIVVSGNTISNVLHARGNALYDGAALYSEFNSRNVIWLGNTIKNCPVALQDNSGDIIYWVSNVIDGCGIGMIYSDAGGSSGAVNARILNLVNNTFVNMVPMTTFPAGWYSNPNATPTSTSTYTNYKNAIYSWNYGWKGTNTFSSTTVTVASLQNTSTGSPGTGATITYTTTGTLPTPLTPGVVYYAKKLSSTTYELYSSYYESIMGINKFTFAGGSGTHTGIVGMSVNMANNVFTSSDPTYAASGNLFNVNNTNITVSVKNTVHTGWVDHGLLGGLYTNLTNINPQLDLYYKPYQGSPCVGTGSFTGYYVDMSGRPFKVNPSIGAYENYSTYTDSYTE
jgi:hypothetical protein